MQGYRGDYKPSEAKLKPCPFCGKDNQLVRPTPGQMYVACLNCDTYGPSEKHNFGTQYAVQEAIAIDQWNTRYDEEGNYQGG